MPTLVHEHDWPDRVVVGTVGMPGSRTFYLQARTGTRTTSVALEKEQSAVLADTIQRLLDELMEAPDNRYSVPVDVPAELVDDDPLDLPLEEEFRAGSMRLSWDPRTAQVVVEAFPFVDEDDDLDPDADEPEPEESFLIRMPVGTARAFAQRTRAVVQAGRPACPRCGRPVDPDGHECVLPDEA
ncbi:DUF3090 domain-containing protein [Cellulosimicrobium cellulans]|uniref:DUF3090 domain-containing protein n=1 Tax=Cellulosimicrobium cellulans TaxID=1710 RepID=UPI0035DA6C41